MLASPGRRLLQAVFYAPRYRGIALREEINDLPQVRLSARTELCFLPNKVTSWDCLQIFEILCPFHFCSICWAYLFFDGSFLGLLAGTVFFFFFLYSISPFSSAFFPINLVLENCLHRKVLSPYLHS